MFTLKLLIFSELQERGMLINSYYYEQSFTYDNSFINSYLIINVLT